ncbi:MAG TPA: hypothetical protein VL463_08360 [Kofleriaceae bacterium]|nr:hypothetical protein [Kofleriaceae bacterium]
MTTRWIVVAALAAGCGLYTGPSPDDGVDAASDPDARISAHPDARHAPDARPAADARPSPDAKPPAGRRVLVLAGYQNTLEVEQVRGALLADPRVASVDTQTIDSSYSNAPGPGVLEAYDAVVYWWNDRYILQAAGRVDFGNRLADYVDSGGAVVTLAYAQGQSSLLGRLLTAGYLPLRPPASAPYEVDAIDHVVTTDPDPITAGEHPISIVDPGATLVASWSDGQPAIAIKGRVVSLGIRLDPTDVSLGGGWQRALDNAVVSITP